MGQRLQVAQSLVEKLVLLTADEVLAAYDAVGLVARYSPRRPEYPVPETSLLVRPLDLLLTVGTC